MCVRLAIHPDLSALYTAGHGHQLHIITLLQSQLIKLEQPVMHRQRLPWVSTALGFHSLGPLLLLQLLQLLQVESGENIYFNCIR